MIGYTNLISAVRKEAKKLEPGQEKVFLELARRFEHLMNSEAIRRAAEEDLKALNGDPEGAIHILGTIWRIRERSESEDERLKDCDGYCDWTTREIVVEREELGDLKNMDRYIRKVKRHEIVHAFLFESGLCHCSCSVEAWAMNEEMVDWLATQGPAICRAWQEAGCLDE